LAKLFLTLFSEKSCIFWKICYSNKAPQVPKGYLVLFFVEK